MQPSESIANFGSSLSLGIISGLFLGKPLGITLAVFILTKLRLVRLATPVNRFQFIGIGILAGIGFTMLIFVSNLAFPGNTMLRDTAKLAILTASGLAMMVSYTWFKIFHSIKEQKLKH